MRWDDMFSKNIQFELTLVWKFTYSEI